MNVIRLSEVQRRILQWQINKLEEHDGKDQSKETALSSKTRMG